MQPFSTTSLTSRSLAKIARKSAQANALPLGRTAVPGTTSDGLIVALQPAVPTYIMRYNEAARAASAFQQQFDGTVLYAVKVNPGRKMLQTLVRSGVRHFDVASLDEAKLVRRLAPKANLFFMHPVISIATAAEAYSKYAVRTFAIDCAASLAKIQTASSNAGDVSLFVRLALPHASKSMIDLSRKFGADFDEAVALLKAARPAAQRLGVTFHVGSQCMDTAAYREAISYAATVIRTSGVVVDAIDIGGGFPVTYPGMTPPPLGAFMHAINNAFIENGLMGLERFCEPGRALVASAASLVVQVDLRKNDVLYINDGTYGGLFDAGKSVQFRYPCRVIRVDGSAVSKELQAFRFAGPTCDSLDMMDGPFYLPTDIRDGDYIEISQMGAYSESLRTGFNGYKDYLTVELIEGTC